MTNDTNTLNGALMELGELMAQHLTDKGVTSSASEGLTTLANKILNITPFVTGIDLSTSLTLNTTYKANTIRKPIDFSTQLKCFFDDLSESDVDLSGYLQGATVKFYNNDTLVETAITDADGKASFQYTPTTLGEFPVYITFEGTDNYSASRSKTFYIIIVNEIIISSITQIIQNTETLDIVATIPDIEGETNLAGRSIMFSNNIDDTDWEIDLNVPVDVIEVGDTINLTTTVVDENKNPMENIVINFYIER